MKKKILTIISIIALALGLSALMIACDDNKEKIEYNVTVISPTEDPLPGVDVSWMSGSKESGKATTNEDGIATATLPSGTYSIVLSGSALEGYDYDPMSVTASEPNAEIWLAVKNVTYTVTVKDKTGNAVQNVAVTWTNGSVSETKTTNASGTASCELEYGTYTVSLDSSTLPDDNVYDGAQTATGANPSVSFNLRKPKGQVLTYKATVKSEGNLLFKKMVAMIWSGSDVLTSVTTDDNGVFTFRAEEGDYNVTLPNVPNGYSYEPVTLTKTENEKEIVLHSEIIGGTPPAANANIRYVIGDIFHNYTFTTPYKLENDGGLGSAIWSKSVSQILKEKDVLLINNWGTNCSWCVQEMPEMEAIYKKYKDQIEMVAVSNYGGGDTDAIVTNYYNANKYSFPMMRDYNGFASKFNLEGWPTTVVIDRYGAIARIEKGAITSLEAWERLIEKFIGKDYEQTFTPGVPNESIVYEIARPDFKVDSDHYDKLGNAVLEKDYTLPAGTSIEWYGDENEDDYWPFLFGKFNNLVSGDDYVLFASNGGSSPTEELYGKTEREGKANSMAILYADVTVKAGQVLTFQYFAETEARDVLSILWDGRIIRQISGDSGGWQTCYLYSEITDGTHKLSITYMKDSSGNYEKDNVFIRNMKFVDVLSITTSTNMLRGAGFGDITKDGKFSHYVEATLNETDGYYHVNLAKLKTDLGFTGDRAGLAGNDESPLLLANLMNVTPWNNKYSISQLVYGVDESGEYAIDCHFTIDGVTRDYRNDLIKYLKAASASDITYCVPVNDFLQKLLVNFMAKVSGENSHDKEWLNICYFYSHYGNGDPISNPVLGLMEETAIKLNELDHEYHADLTREMAPFPSLVYTFTPKDSAIYKIESLIPSDITTPLSSQIWLYDDDVDYENDHYLAYSGEGRVNRYALNEQNFELYYYMQAGHKYYIRVAFLMAASGEYDFKITYSKTNAADSQSYTELIPASADTYDMVIDNNGDWSGEVELSYAIEYELLKEADSDEYFYHVKNSNSEDSYIYLDVKYATTALLSNIPLERLYNFDETDPLTGQSLDYKLFDLRYFVGYHIDPNDNDMVTYDPKTDSKISKDELKYYDPVSNAIIPLSAEKSAKYKDYTAILKSYIDSAPTTGDKAGLIKVDQTIVDMFTAFIELRINSIYDNVVELAIENEWLRFCWCYNTHDATHP